MNREPISHHLRAIATSPVTGCRKRAASIVFCLGMFFSISSALPGSVASVSAGDAIHKPLVLLSEDEALQLRMSKDDWPNLRRTRSVPSGPRISIEMPQLAQVGGERQLEMTSPGTLLVRFAPNKADVNMESLEIRARKGFFSKSLNDLLKPYIRGTTLDVKDVAVPGGQFLIEIEIADVSGAQTLEQYRLNVVEEQ